MGIRIRHNRTTQPPESPRKSPSAAGGGGSSHASRLKLTLSNLIEKPRAAAKDILTTAKSRMHRTWTSSLDAGRRAGRQLSKLGQSIALTGKVSTQGDAKQATHSSPEKSRGEVTYAELNLRDAGGNVAQGNAKRAARDSPEKSPDTTIYAELNLRDAGGKVAQGDAKRATHSSPEKSSDEVTYAELNLRDAGGKVAQGDAKRATHSSPEKSSDEVIYVEMTGLRNAGGKVAQGDAKRATRGSPEKSSDEVIYTEMNFRGVRGKVAPGNAKQVGTQATRPPSKEEAPAFEALQQRAMRKGIIAPPRPSRGGPISQGPLIPERQGRSMASPLLSKDPQAAATKGPPKKEVVYDVPRAPKLFVAPENIYDRPTRHGPPAREKGSVTGEEVIYDRPKPSKSGQKGGSPSYSPPPIPQNTARSSSALEDIYDIPPRPGEKREAARKASPARGSVTKEGVLYDRPRASRGQRRGGPPPSYSPPPIPRPPEHIYDLPIGKKEDTPAPPPQRKPEK